MRRVRVVEIPKRGHVPAHVVALLHRHHRHISKDIAVDRPLEVRIVEARAKSRVHHPSGRHKPGLGFVDAFRVSRVRANIVIELPAFVLIDGDEYGNEFLVHVLRAAARARHAAPRDGDAAEQARGHVAELVRMRVIEPEYGARIVRSGAGTLRDFPDIDVRAARGHGAICFVCAARAVIVIGALGILCVEYTMRVDAVGMRSVVPENHADRVPPPRRAESAPRGLGIAGPPAAASA